ncbi:hypothetical protein EG834_17360, partial [bacterium]|nr:hypothetical protein [bacterium]
MIIELEFQVTNTSLALERMQATGLDVRSISTTIITAGDDVDEDAVRLAAWMWSAEMMAWRDQRAVELARVDALM